MRQKHSFTDVQRRTLNRYKGYATDQISTKIQNPERNSKSKKAIRIHKTAFTNRLFNRNFHFYLVFHSEIFDYFCNNCYT